MTEHGIVGIDIGTHQVKVVIAESRPRDNRQFPRILGTGTATSKGLRHGYIINTADVSKAVRVAVEQASAAARLPVKRAYLSVGGVGLDESRSRGDVAVSRADQEVHETDLRNAHDDAERKITSKLLNRRIIHAIPLGYLLDGAPVMGRPIGMRGSKLSVEMLFITALEQHLHDIIASVEDLGIAVVDVMASPLAGSFVTLTKAQKIAGCVLANIGAETVSIVVFENNVPISLKVFPLGGNDITNDIALNLRVSLEEAEQLKRGALIGATHSKKQLDDIVAGRMADIFSLVEAHLKKINKSGLLPAGIVLTGGATGIATVEDLARASLRLPSRRATLHGAEDAKLIKDASWAVSYGLTIWGLSAAEDSMGIAMARQAGSNLLSWLRQFLP
jgi:cell division protein FtsA